MIRIQELGNSKLDVTKLHEQSHDFDLGGGGG